MTTTRYEVDAVIDRSGRIGRQVWVINGTAALTPPPQPGPIETVRRPGFIVPGLHDAHLHLGAITASTSGVSLGEAADLGEVSRRIAGRDTGDVVAIGFDETGMEPRRLLESSDLDAMISDRAVLVYRVCGHIAMANSAALDRAGISASTPDPPGGSLDRDASGRPSGVLRETAIDLVSAVIDDTSREVTAVDLTLTVERLAALGLTSVTAMVPAGAPAWCGPDDELDRLVAIDGGPAIPIDAVLISNTVQDLKQHAARLLGPNVRFAGWKGFADGSLGGHTAALSASYQDRPGVTGTTRYQPDEFLTMADASLEMGGSVCIHAIGDAAVAHVVDLFSDLIAAGAPPQRLRVEHASVLTPDLIDRMAQLGVLASVQPAFVQSDAHWLDDRLGPERARWTYPFRSMLEAGVRLRGGSDAPVENPDPLTGARAAVHRSGWNVEEALEPWQGLALFAETSFDEGTATWVSPKLDGFERLA